MPKKKSIINNNIDENKIIASLSYVWILCLIPLLLKRDSKFTQFHAKQGLVLFFVEILAGLVAWFPVFGQLLVLLLIVISIVAIIKTLNGEQWEIPVIYEWSKKINI